MTVMCERTCNCISVVIFHWENDSDFYEYRIEINAPKNVRVLVKTDEPISDICKFQRRSQSRPMSDYKITKSVIDNHRSAHYATEKWIKTSRIESLGFILRRTCREVSVSSHSEQPNEFARVPYVCILILI